MLCDIEIPACQSAVILFENPQYNDVPASSTRSTIDVNDTVVA